MYLLVTINKAVDTSENNDKIIIVKMEREFSIKIFDFLC